MSLGNFTFQKPQNIVYTQNNKNMRICIKPKKRNRYELWGNCVSNTKKKLIRK